MTASSKQPPAPDGREQRREPRHEHRQWAEILVFDAGFTAPTAHLSVGVADVSTRGLGVLMADPLPEGVGVLVSLTGTPTPIVRAARVRYAKQARRDSWTRVGLEFETFPEHLSGTTWETWVARANAA